MSYIVLKGPALNGASKEKALRSEYFALFDEEKLTQIALAYATDWKTRALQCETTYDISDFKALGEFVSTLLATARSSLLVNNSSGVLYLVYMLKKNPSIWNANIKANLEIKGDTAQVNMTRDMFETFDMSIMDNASSITLTLSLPT